MYMVVRDGDPIAEVYFDPFRVSMRQPDDDLYDLLQRAGEHKQMNRDGAGDVEVPDHYKEQPGKTAGTGFEGKDDPSRQFTLGQIATAVSPGQSLVKRGTRAEAATGDPLSHIEGLPDDPDRLTRPMLQQYVKAVAERKAEQTDGLTVSAGQQVDASLGVAVHAGSFSRKFEPALHPRNPETGKFVERPFDFDLDQQTLDNAPTTDLLQFLKDEGEPVDSMIRGDDLSIDGIPDDAVSLSDAKQRLDGVDQDLSDRGYVSPDAPDLRLESADRAKPLTTADDGKLGAAAQNMDVAYYDDGDRKAFVKHYRDDMDGPRSDGEKPTLAEREIAADKFLRNLGHGDKVPAQFRDEDQGYMSSQAISGDNIRGQQPAGADNIDEDSFRQFAAATLLVGNSDLHGDNWRVQDDGDFYAIDLNKSGGDFTSPGKFRSRGVAMLTTQARDLGIDMSKEDLQQEAEALARDIDPDEALRGVENSAISDADMHQFRDNIRKNIEAFRRGDVSL